MDNSDIKRQLLNGAALPLWEAELETLIDDFTAAYLKCEGATDELCQFVGGDQLSIVPTYVNLLTSVMRNWASEKCTLVTEVFKGDSVFALVRSDLPRGAGDVRIYQGQANVHIAPVSHVRWLARKCFSVKDFYSVLVECGVNLIEDGHKRCAYALGREFGLCHGREGQPKWRKGIKRVAGHYVIEREHLARYYTGRQQSLLTMKRFAEIFSLEANVSGLPELYAAAYREEETLSDSPHHYIVPSRTRVDVPGSGSVVFYSDKLAFHISPSLFESLVAFVSGYIHDGETMDVSIVN